jgi:hypothetical protein
VLEGDSTARIAYSCLEGPEPWPGPGNINEPPQFVAPGEWQDGVWVEGDYHLEPGSPCIGSGHDGCDRGVDLDGICEAQVVTFRRGHVNADDNVDLSDAVGILGYLFLGEAEPPCLDALDVDDNGGVELTDAIALLGYLYLGGVAPAAPFESCGEDPASDGLGCTAFPLCR